MFRLPFLLLYLVDTSVSYLVEFDSRWRRSVLLYCLSLTAGAVAIKVSIWHIGCIVLFAVEITYNTLFRIPQQTAQQGRADDAAFLLWPANAAASRNPSLIWRRNGVAYHFLLFHLIMSIFLKVALASILHEGGEYRHKLEKIRNRMVNTTKHIYQGMKTKYNEKELVKQYDKNQDLLYKCN